MPSLSWSLAEPCSQQGIIGSKACLLGSSAASLTLHCCVLTV